MTIRAENVGKTLGDPPVRILRGISLELKDGEFAALTGRSGSGKSTLLYILSSLDYCSEGTISIDGRDPRRMGEKAVGLFRNAEAGFVFQFHYLVGELTALENVLLPARKAGREEERRLFAEDLLDRFELGALKHRFPRHLSGGEQQRVAIARALVMEPRYLFADEPTGNLDSVSGGLVMDILRETNKRLGTTVLLVTHDAGYAAMAGRRIQLADGRVVP